jgi:hypothetical protein
VQADLERESDRRRAQQSNAEGLGSRWGPKPVRIPTIDTRTTYRGRTSCTGPTIQRRQVTKLGIRRRPAR